MRVVYILPGALSLLVLLVPAAAVDRTAPNELCSQKKYRERTIVPTRHEVHFMWSAFLVAFHFRTPSRRTPLANTRYVLLLIFPNMPVFCPIYTAVYGKREGASKLWRGSSNQSHEKEARHCQENTSNPSEAIAAETGHQAPHGFVRGMCCW